MVGTKNECLDSMEVLSKMGVSYLETENGAKKINMRFTDFYIVTGQTESL